MTIHIEKYDYPPDFVTHLNYVTLLNQLSNQLKITYDKNIQHGIPYHKIIKSKTTIIRLTYRNLEWEHKIIKLNSEYAPVCVSWISVKTYYILYNLCLLLKFLITGNLTAFNSSHTSILSDFKNYLLRKEITFSEVKFNNVYFLKDISELKTSSGVNIKRKLSDEDKEIRYYQILKKLMKYNIEEWKRQNRINNFRSKQNNKQLNDFLCNKEICICDFFYWYRIKANYRDLEFLNKDISDKQFVDFYINYFELMNNFYIAYKTLINNLAIIRFNEPIIV